MEQEIKLIVARYGLLARMMGVFIVWETLVEMGLAFGVVECFRRLVLLRNWTLAFFAALRWLTQKALQNRQVIGHLYYLLTHGLHESARVFVAMLTHHISER